MRLFPGYNLSQVLSEPAPWFFNLLQQGLQLEADSNRIQFAMLCAANSEDNESRKKLDRNLEEAARDKLDLIPVDDGRSVDVKEIARFLG